MKRKILIIIGVILAVLVVAAAGLFVGLRFLFGRSLMSMWRSPLPMMGQVGRQPDNSGWSGRSPGNDFNQLPGGMNRSGNGMGMGMPGWGGMGMGPGNFGGSTSPFQLGQTTGDRISIDQAQSHAQDSINKLGSNLKIAEVMEFANNFYVSVKETDSGRGAFELLVDPFSGAVSSEPGPNMMWNTKYGHMNLSGQAAQSEMSVDQAAQKARDYLKKVLPTAELQTDGLAYYGYVTFDYKVNGLVAGMLSVNSTSGAVWMHTWHGVFISEKSLQ